MIEIEKYQAVNRGHLVGVVDLKIPKWCLSFKGVAVFEKAGGRWVNLPQKTFQGDDGKTKYVDTIEWTDKAVEGRFRDAVLTALVEAGHLEPSKPKPPPSARPNRKNPQRMTYRGGQYRPDDFQGVTSG
jgi:hypothetical protein